MKLHPKLRAYARKEILEGLRSLQDTHQQFFRDMYGRNGGARSLEGARAMSLEDVVDEIPDEKLSWALTQVETTKSGAAPVSQENVPVSATAAVEPSEGTSNMFAFWKYDRYPFLLGGEYTKVDTAGAVYVPSFQSWRKPELVLDAERGAQLRETLKTLERQYKEESERLLVNFKLRKDIEIAEILKKAPKPSVTPPEKEEVPW